MPRAFAFSLVVLLLLLTAVSSQSGAQGADQNPAKVRLSNEWQELLQDTASKHVDLGTKFQTADDLSRAIRQYRSALWLVPDHRAARLSLGYKLEEGKWVEDVLLKEPEPVDESRLSEAERSARERQLAATDRRCQSILREEAELSKQLAKTALNFASRAGLLGQETIRVAALRVAGAYAPYDTNVARARGLLARDGEWEHPLLLRQAQLAARRLTDASSGRPTLEPDPQATQLGWKTFDVRTDDTLPFSIRTTKGMDRAIRLMKVADATSEVSRELLGVDLNGGFKEGRFVVTEVADREQFHGWLDKFDKASPLQRAINRGATSIWTQEPFGCLVQWFSDIASDDACSNNVAMAVQWNVRGRQSDPWVRDGFCYLVTTRLLNTTMIKRYDVESRTRTSDWNFEQNRVPRGNPYGPAEFRRLALEMVRLGGDVSFSDLAATPTSRMTERHIAKSLAVMEFLVFEHYEKFKQWMTVDVPRLASGDLARLLQLLELDEAELQQAWAEWIANHY